MLRLFYMDDHDDEVQKVSTGGDNAHAKQHQQNAAFNAFLQPSSLFYTVHLKTGLSLVRALTVVFGCELQNMSGDEVYAVQEHTHPQRNGAKAEKRQLAGANPMLVTNSGGNSSMVTPVKTDSSGASVSDPELQAPLSPWIRTPAPNEDGGSGYAGEALVDEDEDEDDVMWNTDSDHNADVIEVDLNETMRRFWRTYVSMTGEAAFVEALVHNTQPWSPCTTRACPLSWSS